MKLLHDRDLCVRATAASTLGDLGPEANVAIPKLRELLHDDDRSMCETAAEALKKIDKKNE